MMPNFNTKYVQYSYGIYCIGVGAGPVLAGPLFLAVPAGLVFGRTTGALEQHSNPTLGLHVLLAGPLFEAVLRHCIGNNNLFTGKTQLT